MHQPRGSRRPSIDKRDARQIVGLDRAFGQSQIEGCPRIIGKHQRFGIEAFDDFAN